ncbi:hypothetical protein FGO68_gene13341 [Halteria grandinella]|uniref:Uncharacterized protein n=1 Tax=Halteria grandinella TaxID=5974 RepID=A0A8J8N8X2_HALGN|nr:hypothetical protein FGO68_gene13341 [Halteria grandinella]
MASFTQSREGKSAFPYYLRNFTRSVVSMRGQNRFLRPTNKKMSLSRILRENQQTTMNSTKIMRLRDI